MAKVNNIRIRYPRRTANRQSGPHQTKEIWGKLYIIPNDIDELLRRYQRDFETELGK